MSWLICFQGLASLAKLGGGDVSKRYRLNYGNQHEDYPTPAPQANLHRPGELSRAIGGGTQSGGDGSEVQEMTLGDILIIDGRLHEFIAYSVSGHMVTVTREARGILIYSDGVLVGKTAPSFPLVRKEVV